MTWSVSDGMTILTKENDEIDSQWTKSNVMPSIDFILN